MKTTWLTTAILSIAALTLAATLAHAAAPSGPTTSNVSASEQTCRACHTLDTSKIGPPFRSIAERYKNDGDAVAKLKKSMLEGSSGKWGAAQMPPNAISEADAERFAHWILSLNHGAARDAAQGAKQ